MSKETQEWLSTNTLIGFTNKRGHAWHHRAGDQNWYPEAIPVEDVRKRLFEWHAEERPVYVGGHGDPFTAQLNAYEIPRQKAIVRSDNGNVLGIFKDGYQPHQYDEWLLDNVATILDSELQIGSAGLLKGGAVAWVSVEMPETLETIQGVRFRPFLLAATSFDGSIATTYKEVVTRIQCDNTLAVGLNEKSATVKVRHSAKSLNRIQSVRDALGIVHKIAEDFELEVAELTSVKISDADWEKIIEDLIPLPEKKPGQALKRREVISRLYRHDARVAPWAGTAFGAWQAFNTYGQHESGVRGVRQERNMLRAVKGEIENEDRETVARILAVAA